ncbi:hypothetical protein VTL71DRAFT_11696 [Oculimacula yallundae]|uniref:Uncharacterized protein n=1 Tax=Oculimacula yallundae TaxID=86028 RepID=A0ABR4CSM0_9HELO
MQLTTIFSILLLTLSTLVSAAPIVEALQPVARDGPPQDFSKPCRCVKKGHWCDARTGRGQLIGNCHMFTLYICDKADAPPEKSIDCGKTHMLDKLPGMCQYRKDMKGDVCGDHNQWGEV